MSPDRDHPYFARSIPAWLSLILLFAWAPLPNTLGAGKSGQEDQDAFLVTSKKRAGMDWWSFQPVTRPALPKLSQAGWVRNPIDAFVLAQLEKRNLEPAPEARARQVIRRLHFSLLGLPPSPPKVDAFLKAHQKDSRAAIQALVRELLQSPHYGERWARHWLDVARFGESNGFEYDQLRPNAWPYRDWVIDALNDDMPYDQFVRWQIAGDLLEPDNADAVTATSFLICGAFDGLLPQGDKMRRIMRQDELEDLVGTVGQTFLGLTVHCARCHDHKFDPIRQKEYYQLSSALAGVRRGDRTVTPGENVAGLKKQVKDLEARISSLEGSARLAIEARLSKEPRQGPVGPAPIAEWTFDKDFRDQVGNMHGEPRGKARLENGALRLDDNSSYVTTSTLTRQLKEKTLAAWVRLDGLNQKGGAAISLQATDGGQFDAIVYGERENRRWMAGSDGFRRSQSFAGTEEKEAGERFIHMAITYAGDGTITAYRNGLPYGRSFRSDGPVTFSSGNHQVLFGLRHGTGAQDGRMLKGWIDRAQLFDRVLTQEEVAVSADATWISEKQIVEQLTPDQRRQRSEWQSTVARLKSELAKKQNRKVYAVTPKSAPVAHLLVRGSPFQRAEEVSANGVAALASVPRDFGLKPDAPESDRRRKLAEWISHEDNPLLARVMVNRLWHYYFGQGLVTTPNDFGFNGGHPSHPELLEWLAAELRESGWRLKRIHYLITTSATYLQSSKWNTRAAQVDAGNRWLWRHAPARLEAEILRDAILKVSGQLNTTMGGPGFRDFKMYKHKGSWVYDPIDPEGEEFNRRSIYRTWARGNVHPLLSTFDCPDPSATAPVRSVTTTPLGALALLNASFVLRMADKFAERVEADAGQDPKKQIRRAYTLALGRPPSREELQLTRNFLEHNGLPALCRVLFNANEFLYVN